jgi:hypothetical protein
MKVHPTPVFSMNDEMAIDMLKVTEGEFTNPGGIFFHRVCRTNYTDTLRPQINHPV